jgi:hypothetical protein
MLIDLYGMEEANRLRQATIARDVELYSLKAEPGPVRRLFGSMLVRVGESMRGSVTRPTTQPTPVVATTVR